eukprot:CAMPEP_0183756316 /NCGR_PEP_ID=MMETSP0739-20130205/4931_1 /TAXON_ID=385413 /ORGANISM="Thalassiosira miniscula, Strain CCMP1093" /LENGTH=285 /DNA_ID=CAMNT_0025993463 /DNA_START=46 /DNA_END=903 /DNA_ORIENTATION=+
MVSLLMKLKRKGLALPITKDKQDLCNCISTMLKQEEQYLCYDYMQVIKTKKEGVINASCRSKVTRWILQTVRRANLRSETAIMAVSYLDRFLCSTSSPRARKARCDRRQYQLVAMTSLYMAIKINEPNEMDADTISQLSRGFHSAEDITSCERDMLSSLRWKVQGPTPLQFINYMLELFQEDNKSSARSVTASAVCKLHYLSQRQTELATEDYAFVPIRGSKIAIASIVNALLMLPREDCSAQERIQFVQVISDTFQADVDSPLMKAMRRRLLEKYTKSLRCKLP